MKTTLVSIITPTLNQAAFIDDTIRSIKNQTYQDLEHIVVDGGSTDGTLDILRRHAGTYPLRWISERDTGMYDAINKGLRLANGEVVAYLNSDDLYFPWTLRAVVDAFHRRPEADFIFGDFLHVDVPRRGRRLVHQPPFDLDFIRRTGFLGQPAVFWRQRAGLELGGFDTDLRFVADCDYWMRAGKTQQFVRVDEVLAIDREHGGSLRQTGTASLEDELIRVRSRYVQLHGADHKKRMRRHRVRAALYRRWYALRFALQATAPPVIRGSAWRHFLNAPGVRLSLFWALISQIPMVGWRYVDRVVHVPESIAPPDPAP